jgi:endogenous inhibitor of DNA gyrase (YacG/DUF329 family)
MSKVKSVNCPSCLKQVLWDSSNPYRPFCSERCKLLDLGDWASGRHAIVGEPAEFRDQDEAGIDAEDMLD